MNYLSYDIAPSWLVYKNIFLNFLFDTKIAKHTSKHLQTFIPHAISTAHWTKIYKWLLPKYFAVAGGRILQK